MRCSRCAWEQGHDPSCPEQIQDVALKEAVLRDYDEGYRAGRSGLEIRSNKGPYKLGWGRGVVALEEAENGYDPRFD